MRRFEYIIQNLAYADSMTVGGLIVKTDKEKLECVLNGMGSEGWELVSILTEEVQGTITARHMILKRELPDASE